ncbi:hypothetical protein Fmac_011749 [Flemingia macrophylla]|uniref:Uncharacterized protein n=1 Tax=Flemingia macrophylla TaxID=520843 RepID=A0ABD1MNB6_9FABA
MNAALPGRLFFSAHQLYSPDEENVRDSYTCVCNSIYKLERNVSLIVLLPHKASLLQIPFQQ